MSFEEDAGEKAVAGKATQAQEERKYPVRPEEAREVAIRRLRYRRGRGSESWQPTDFRIWTEWMRFPEIFGQRPLMKGLTIEMERRWLEHWREHVEAEDVKVYGQVRDTTVRLFEDVAMRIDPIAEEPERPGWVPTMREKIEIEERCIERARAEGSPEDGPRIRFHRKRLARFQGKVADAGSALGLADDVFQSVDDVLTRPRSR